MFIEGLITGNLIGLLIRRRKWHLAEYRRIIDHLRELKGPQVAAALMGASQHYAAAAELDAVLERREPSWGPEREITESYLTEEDKREPNIPQPSIGPRYGRVSELPSEETVGLGLA